MTPHPLFCRAPGTKVPKGKRRAEDAPHGGRVGRRPTARIGRRRRCWPDRIFECKVSSNSDSLISGLSSSMSIQLLNHYTIFARNAFADLKPQVRKRIVSRRTQTESLTASPCTTTQIKKSEGCVCMRVGSRFGQMNLWSRHRTPVLEALYE
jgi:hypothetical protein